jgi:hypothetical protein
MNTTQTFAAELTAIISDPPIPDAGIESTYPGITALQQAVSAFPKISLEEMAEVKLMNRIDVKYLVQAEKIPELLNRASEDYYIQEIDGKTVSDYGTLYLDTSAMTFFIMHMNGKLNRLKWRIRSYIGSDLSFLELKRKTNKGRTQKRRVIYDHSKGLSGTVASEFIFNSSGIKAEHLQPVLQNCFNRITLVNQHKTERLTIDLNITFRNCRNGKVSGASNLAIIEIKQDRNNKSKMDHYIDEMRIKKSGISKYCLGMVLTDDAIKGNLYKRKIRYINKITSQR